MGKQEWKAGNMIYPLPVVMATVRDRDGKDNIITVAWTGTTCTNPAMAYISVRPGRYSYHMLQENKCFVINLTTKALVKAADYCGVVSGRDVDKFAKCNLTKTEASHINCAMIEESPVNIECEVVQEIEQGSHTMFLAKVICVHADEAYMNETGKFCLEKAEPVVYSHGTYFALGEEMGTFGYSVKKKKKKS